jgi:hypothetical protein
MNKSIFLLVNLLGTALYCSSDRSFQASIPSRILVSASAADLTQVCKGCLKSTIQYDQTRNTSSSSSLSLGSENNSSSSTRKTPSPILVISRNSPDQTLSFIREQVEKKYCQQYNIKSDALKQCHYTEMESLIDSLSSHFRQLIENSLFESASYQKLHNIVYELKRFDCKKRFWRGSMIVDAENEDILKIEHEKMLELKKKGIYLFAHGSVSRLEKRQEYLREREELLKTLLKKM